MFLGGEYPQFLTRRKKKHWCSHEESLLLYVIHHLLAAALIASTCSTGALHYLLSPFINSIYLHTTKSSVQSTKESITPNTVITLETLDLFARRRQTTLPLRDLVPSSGLLLTWTVNRKVIERQYAEERLKGVAPTIKQTRFWLDRRNGVGDAEAMSQVLRVIQENHRRRRVVWWKIK